MTRQEFSRIFPGKNSPENCLNPFFKNECHQPLEILPGECFGYGFQPLNPFSELRRLSRVVPDGTSGDLFFSHGMEPIPV